MVRPKRGSKYSKQYIKRTNTKIFVLGNASDAVCDQMMRHDPKFATFHGAYLNKNVEFNLQNTFLEEETEEQMYKVFAHVSLTRDPRVTRDMVLKEV
ncbi:uncharacterized protein ColSpa_11964 [Colletotrichum spaethianum]|uniref:Uncharacterized protein n=1 Tax=Colletotrichum spaethianum TaxID=700344 RepID=A0AA37UTE8_9PEZI|nr:uncharacterized protein ColSpa_11964 [Colletotrichum spaethianum]GKT51783.1 hypothetical protein ColSpa_11964 [Colletotrichum spaethianum]